MTTPIKLLSDKEFIVFVFSFGMMTLSPTSASGISWLKIEASVHEAFVGYVLAQL